MDFLRFLWSLLLSNLHLVSALATMYLIVALAHREGARAGVPRGVLNTTESWALIGAVAGARLAEVAPDWDLYLGSPVDLLRVNLGLSIYGALAGAALVLAWGARRWRLPLWTMADAYALFAPLGIALHRFGCLLHGDCAGRPAEAPLGVALPGLTLPRYPSDLYEAVLTLALFGALLLLSARRAPAGVLVGVFLVGYPVVRSLVDLTRLASSTSLWGDVAPALILVALGVAVLARTAARNAGRNAAAEPSE